MVRSVDPDKRKAFLDAALALFVCNGVQGTSTAAIAREAGTATGTLFLYFPTKQDLVDELAMEISREQAQAVNSRLNPDMNAHESFRTIWEAVITWFRSHPEAYRYIQIVRDTGILSPRVAEETGRLFSFYYETVRKGLAEGSVRNLPPELVGEILYRNIVAVMNLIAINPDTEKQEEYFRLGFEIFREGIRGKK